MNHTSQDHFICYRCGTRKPLDAFTCRIDERYYNMCRVCVSEVLLQGQRGKKERLHHTKTMRTCYLCRRFLPVDRFTQRSNGTYFSACKDCNRHVFAQRRRARLQGADGTYTRDQWEALVQHYPHCPMCKRLWNDIPTLTSGASVITVDHIMPLSKGGSNHIENLQPLCYSCNSKKGAKVLSRIYEG